MKAGRWTVAGSFITIGVVLLLNQWVETNLLIELLPWWPVVLIALGVEVILFYRKGEGTPKFDVAGLVLLGLVVVAGSVGVSFACCGPKGPAFLFDGNWVEEPLEPLIIPVDGQDTLELGNDIGRIDVTTHDGKEVIIEPSFMSSSRKEIRQKESPDFIVDKSVRTISIDVRDHTHPSGIFNIPPRWWLQLKVKVPTDFSIDLHSDNGEIKVQDIVGRVHAATDNGKVEAAHIDGDTVLKTDNGMIEAMDIKGSVDANTANGAVHINGVQGDVHAETSNGKVSIKSSTLSGHWEAETELGIIEVAIPVTSDAVIEATAELGRVASDFSLEQERDIGVGGTSTGIIGEGTYGIRLKTDLGNIKIKKLQTPRD